MPDFDKNLRPIIKETDVNLPNIELPPYSGTPDVPFRPNLAEGDKSLEERFFGRPGGPHSGSQFVSAGDLYANRRYPKYSPGIADIEDENANYQSSLDKAANGLLKGTAIIGTTIAGGFTSLYGLGKSLTPGGKLSDIWDNEGSRALQQINDELDQTYLPNYETNVERDAKWYSPDFWAKTNFLFNHLIKNSGFAVGAMVSGNIANAALGALGKGLGTLAARGAAAAASSEAFSLFTPVLRNTARAMSVGRNLEAAAVLENELTSIGKIGKATQDLAAIAKQTKMFNNIALNGRRTLIAAHSINGEAMFETQQTTDEYYKGLVENYKKEHGGEDPTPEIEKDFQTQANELGKLSYLGNVALLGVTEFAQLPYLLGSSFANERRAANAYLNKADDVVLKDGKYIASMPTTKFGKFVSAAGAIKYIFDPKEAAQEVGQYALQVGSQNYFRKAYQTNDADAWTDLVMYGLFDKEKGAFYSKEGMESLFLGGITGGVMQGPRLYKENQQKKSATQNFINALNNSASGTVAFKDAFVDKLDAANRGVVLQAERQDAILNNDKLESKDLLTDTMFNYLNTRVKYGRYDMVKEDIADIRNELYGNTGLPGLKEQGIFAINDTVQTAEKKLKKIEQFADKLNDVVESLDIRYAGAVDEQNKPLYPQSVRDQMAYAVMKIDDYSYRIGNLRNEFSKDNIPIDGVLEAITESEGYQTGDWEKVLKDEKVVNAIKKASADIKQSKPLDPEIRLQDLQDYTELIVRKRFFELEYGELKKDPRKFEMQPSPSFREEQEKGEVQTAPGEEVQYITIPKKTKEVVLETGKEYLIFNINRFSLTKQDTFKDSLRVTLLAENEDGTVKVQTNDGFVKNVDKSLLAKYDYAPYEQLATDKDLKFYHDNWNKRFTYNYGKGKSKKYSGEKEGRVVYDPATKKLMFVFNEKGRKPINIDRAMFSPKKGYKNPLIREIGTVSLLNTHISAAERVLYSDEEREQLLNDRQNFFTNEQKLVIINDAIKDTEGLISDLNDKLESKRQKLLSISAEIESLETGKRGGKEKIKSTEAITKTTKSLNKLAKMKQEVEDEIAALEKEMDTYEMYMTYLEELKEGVEESATDLEAYVKDIDDKIQFLQDTYDAAESTVESLQKLSKQITNAINKLASMLNKLYKSFATTYPAELKASIERAMEGENPEIEQAVIDSYLEDVNLMGDTEKQIEMKKEELEKVTAELDDAREKLAEAKTKLDAMKTVSSKFDNVLQQWRELQEETANAAKNRELQQKFFELQKKAERNSGDEPTLDRGKKDDASFIEDAEYQLPTATRTPDRYFSGDIAGSASTRPSDIRRDYFLSRVDFLPAEKRKKLRRVFVTENNEDALGLTGLIEKHNTDESGEVWTTSDFHKKTVLALYVEKKSDTEFYYIDKDGNTLDQKLYDKGPNGEPGVDLDQLVWSAMPASAPTVEQLPKVDRKTTDMKLLNLYLQSWIKKKEEILSFTKNTQALEFDVSAGIYKKQYKEKIDEAATNETGKVITKRTPVRNYIVGSLITKEQLDSKTQYVDVAKRDGVQHQGRTLNMKPGKVFVKNGGALTIVNNRNFTQNEQETMFEVLKQFADIANKEKRFDTKLLTFLQGISDFRSPFERVDDVVTKKPIGRNQWFIHNSNFVFGPSQYTIPFSSKSLEIHKAEVMEYLSGLYNNVNNTFLKNPKPFTAYEFVNGELKEVTYDTYQHYLLDPTGRTREEMPLYTNVREIDFSNPEDTNIEQGSRYGFTPDLLKVALPKNVAPKPAPKPAPTATTKVLKTTAPAVPDSKHVEFNKLPAKSATPTMTYAGIGSRSTPAPMLRSMTKMAEYLESMGYTLNTGVTFNNKREGADKAFADGVKDKKNVNLFAPEDAGEMEIKIAKEIHPAPDRLSEEGLKLMARNTNQVFGANLDTPVDFVLVWTKDRIEHHSKRTPDTGGSGQAIELASRKGIPVINMANPNWQNEVLKIVDPSKVKEEVKPKPKVSLGAAAINQAVGDLAKALGLAPEALGGKSGLELYEQSKEAEYTADDIPFDIEPEDNGAAKSEFYKNAIEEAAEEAPPVQKESAKEFVKRFSSKPDAKTLAGAKEISIEDIFRAAQDLSGKKPMIINGATYEMANVQKELDYIKEKTDLNVEMFNRLVEVGNGVYAWGAYQDGLIELYDKMQAGTGYHELLHGVFDVYLSDKERNNMYRDFNSRQGSYTDRTGKVIKYSEASMFDAEEEIAEELRRKMLFDTPVPKSQKSLISRIIDNLINWIKSALGLNTDAQTVEDLFKRIDAGLYKGMAQKVPSGIRKFSRKVGTLDTAQTKSLIDSVAYNIFNEMLNEGRLEDLITLDYKDLSVKQTYEKIKKKIEDYYIPTEVVDKKGKTTIEPSGLIKDLASAMNLSVDEFMARGGGASYLQAYLPMIRAIQMDWDKVIQYTGDFLKVMKIKQTLESNAETDEDYDGSDRTESYAVDAFTYDAKANAPAVIKFMVATIQDSIFRSSDYSPDMVYSPEEMERMEKEAREVVGLKDSVTGLEKLVDYSKMFNQIFYELSTVNTLKGKEQKIREIAKTDANFQALIERLNLNTPVVSEAEWALRAMFYNTFSKDIPEPLAMYILEDGSTVVRGAEIETITKSSVQRWFETLRSNTALVTLKGNSYYFNAGSPSLNIEIKTISDAFEYLEALGIVFDSDQLTNMTRKDQEQIFNEVARIKSTFGKKTLLANKLADLTVTERLKKIFRFYVSSAEATPQTTITNFEKNQVQRIMQTNAVSRTVNDINNARTLDELKELNPQFDSAYASDSLYLNAILYDQESGEKNDKKLSTGYTMGVYANALEEGTNTDRLDKYRRLLQVFTMNLAGHYYVLAPADAKIERTLRMDNLFNGITPEFLDRMWIYYQTERSLPGKTKGRLFEFIGDKATKDKFNTAITNFIQSEVTKQIQELADARIITRGTNFYKFMALNKTVAEQFNVKPSSITEEDIRRIFEYRTVNFMVNNTEIHKMFFGDPAYYKDAIKRYKSFLSPREQSIYDTPEYDNFANRTYNKVGGVKLVPGVPGYQLYKNSLTTVAVEDVLSEVPYLKNYVDIKGTDGQAFSLPSAHRQMLQKSGRWTPAMARQAEYDDAMDRLAMKEDGLFDYNVEGLTAKQNEALYKHDVAQMNQGNPASAEFVVLKPVVSGFSGDVPILDKYSIAPLMYRAVRGTNLAKVYVRMLNQGIDYIVFQSGRKVGAVNVEPLFDEKGKVIEEPFSDDAIVEVPFKWFGIQVETSTKKRGSRIGSQLSAMATMNMMDGGVPIDYEGQIAWNLLTEKQKREESALYKLIVADKEIREAMIVHGKNILLERIGINSDGTVDSKKFLDSIKDSLTRRELNDNLREALNINPETQDFLVPLEALNNYEEIKNIVYSYIEKNLSAITVNGGQKVQISGAGFEVEGTRVEAKMVNGKKVFTSTGLPFYENEDGKRRIGVLITNPFAKQLRAAGIKITDKELFNQLKKTDEGRKLLTGVGFRIPTQNTNSADVFEVMGFLPESMGPVIVVPEALVLKSGTDFDVDKLNTYLKNVYIDDNGDIVEIPYYGTGEKAKNKLMALATKRFRAQFDNLKDAKETMSVEEMEEIMFSDVDYLYKKSLENGYFRNLEEILTLESTFDRLVEPNSSEDYKALAKRLTDINEDEFGEGTLRNVMSPSYMNNVRHSGLNSKGLVGIAATNQKQHAMMQKASVTINPANQNILEDSMERMILEDDNTAGIDLPSNKVVQKFELRDTISGIKDVDGKFITSKLSQYVDGSVDAFKENFLAKLGVNRNNMGIFLLLERHGVSQDVVASFMNQPIIRELNKIMGRENKKTPYSQKVRVAVERLFPASVKEVNAIKDYESYYGTTENLAENLFKEIEKYYGKGSNKTLSRKDNAFQRFILKQYLKYNVLANNLFRAGQAIVYDTINLSAGPYTFERKLTQTEAAISDDATVKGLKFDATKMPYSNMYTNLEQVLDNTFQGALISNFDDALSTIGDSLFLFSKPDIQKYYFPAIKELIERKYFPERDFIRLARKVEQSFIDYMVLNSAKSGNTKLADLITRLLVDEKTSFLKSLTTLQKELMTNPDSDLARNPIIKQLGPKPSKNANPTKAFRMFNRARDLFSENTYIAAMEELKENPITRSLYNNLVRAAFLQSGVATGFDSLTDLIPVEDFKELLLPAIEEINKNNKPLMQAFLDTEAFYRNNWKDFKLIPRIVEEKSTILLPGQSVLEDYSNFYDLETEDVVNNLFEDARVEKYAKSLGLKSFPMYRVQAYTKPSYHKYVMLNKNVGGQPLSILLRRLDASDTDMHIIEDKDSKFHIYFPMNAWGDGNNGIEYYDVIKKSVYNNNTFKLDVEITEDEMRNILISEPITTASTLSSEDLKIINSKGYKDYVKKHGRPMLSQEYLLKYYKKCL